MSKMFETIKNSNKTKSLANIGIPASGTGILRPKVSYQWRLNATGEMNDPALSKQVTSCTRPTLQFDEIAMSRESEDGAVRTVRMAGKHSWDPLTIVVEDDLAGSAARVIQKQIEHQMAMWDRNAPSTAKFDMTICAMDGNDVVADTWAIKGCFIQEANYGDLEYSSSSAVTVTLKIHFDYARMELPE